MRRITTTKRAADVTLLWDGEAAPGKNPIAEARFAVTTQRWTTTVTGDREFRTNRAAVAAATEALQD